MGKKKKLRAQFRKNQQVRVRRSDWTRQFETHGFEQQDLEQGERVSGKGALTRQRTIVAEDSSADQPQLEVDETNCLRGRVISVYGLISLVETPEGRRYHCATRRLLKSLATDQRHVVAAGDNVVFRPAPSTEPIGEGIIERVEPRRGVLSRSSRGRQHVIVANVDQVLIVGSAAEPDLKPHLIDRFLVTAESCGIRPVVVINKVDLVDLADLQPLIGVYAQMGYTVLGVSAATGFGVDRLRRVMQGRHSAVAGQSGVGKSSLLNAVDPDLQLRVREVSRDTQKGRHTTTSAMLVPLSGGGYVVDTPGIRQFQLWDVVPEEVAGWFRDIRPFVSHCRFPDCTHTHEEDCAVKDAVADDLLDARRYDSFCHLFAGDEV